MIIHVCKCIVILLYTYFYTSNDPLNASPMQLIIVISTKCRYIESKWCNNCCILDLCNGYGYKIYIAMLRLSLGKEYVTPNYVLEMFWHWCYIVILLQMSWWVCVLILYQSERNLQLSSELDHWTGILRLLNPNNVVCWNSNHVPCHVHKCVWFTWRAQARQDNVIDMLLVTLRHKQLIIHV